MSYERLTNRRKPLSNEKNRKKSKRIKLSNISSMKRSCKQKQYNMLAALAAVFSCLRLHSSSDKVFCRTVSSGGNGIAITCQPNSASCISSLNYWLAMCIVLNFSRKKVGIGYSKMLGKAQQVEIPSDFSRNTEMQLCTISSSKN